MGLHKEQRKEHQEKKGEGRKKEITTLTLVTSFLKATFSPHGNTLLCCVCFCEQVTTEHWDVKLLSSLSGTYSVSAFLI